VGILIVQLLNSLLYASMLFLLSAGLNLIYGVMRIVNLAHGTIYALGAYVAAWAVGAMAGRVPVVGLYALLPFGAIAAAALGLVLEPLLLRPLYKRTEEYILLATFGLLMVLEDGIRFIWGGTPLSATIIWESMGSLDIMGLKYPTYNLVVFLVGLLAALALWLLVYRTRFGLLLRATSQNMRMAQALGLNVNRVYVQAFAIGCFMAGLGGAIIVPSQAAVLGMGVDALVLAFVVVVIGGLGSLEGAFVGALLVGFVRTLGITFFPEIELAVLYLLAAAVLLIRPTGLFGKAS
jgi:branched-chain amino acid transport system permease protein